MQGFPHARKRPVVVKVEVFKRIKELLDFEKSEQSRGKKNDGRIIYLISGKILQI